jgi:hypothetical protein
MDREALEALEKRIVELRLMTAEKAVLARSLSHREPMMFARPIATAILAVCVLAGFLVAREVGIFMARNGTCLPMHPNEFASIHLASEGVYSVTIDTNGNLTRDVAFDGKAKHPGLAYMRVPPAAVHDLANRLVTGCMFERKPRWTVDFVNQGWVNLTVHVGDQSTAFSHLATGKSIPMCGGTDDLVDVERAIAQLARVDEAL